MRAMVALAESGLRSLWAYRLRTGAILLVLIWIQTPYLTGLALTQGLLDQAEISIEAGADLTVTATTSGRETPLPLPLVERIRRMPGVRKAVPRLIGSATLGSDEIEAVVVGIETGEFPEALESVEGRWFGDGPTPEIVLGRGIAEALHIRVGDVLPPFYNSRRGDRLVKVVGIFHSEISLWQSRLLLTSFETASRILDAENVCSDLLVYVDPGYAEAVAVRMAGRDLTGDTFGSLRLRYLFRDEARRLLPAGVGLRQTALSFFLLPALALGGVVVLLASGLGDSERRREVGVLKALGWTTDQVLLRGVVESIAIALFSAAVSLVLTYAWLRLANGAGIAAMVFPGTDAFPDYRVPYRLPANTLIVAVVVSTAMVIVPGVGSQWRTATADTREAMR